MRNMSVTRAQNSTGVEGAARFTAFARRKRAHARSADAGSSWGNLSPHAPHVCNNAFLLMKILSPTKKSITRSLFF